MTDEHETHDSIDGEGPNENESEGGNLKRRQFMQGAATSVAGLGGLAAFGGSAEAAGTSGTPVIVVGRGQGKHTYEIVAESGATISKADFAGPNDSVGRSDGKQRANGELWHWNADSYIVSGDVHSIELNGTVSVHAPGGVFVGDERIAVGGEGSGKHHYEVGTNSGDLDRVSATTWGGTDSDDFGSKSEKGYSYDRVSGRITDDGADTYTVGSGQPVQYVRVDGGHASVSAYQPANSLNKGSRGTASIVFFYMGDGPFTTFFQNFTDLTPALDGYDRTFLLKHHSGVSGVSVAAHNKADTVRKPTRENFEHCIEALTDAGYTIDLYIMSHGWHGTFKMSEGTHGSEDWYGVSDVQDLRSSFEGDVPLRMVYQSSCWGSELNSAWRRLGAEAAAGARFVNFFPNQFSGFAKRWRNGDTFQQAVSGSNTASSRQAAKAYLTGDAGLTEGDEWGSDSGVCFSWDIWQGQGACAQDYFTNRWNHSNTEWNSVSMDGWHFAQHASEQLIDGNGSITHNFTY